MTAEAGINIDGAPWGTYGAAWGDYDNDGHVDLFICRHAVAPVLYRNNGRGAFVDVSEQAGILAGILEENLFLLDRHGCAWGDFDGDGFLDLYCSMGAQDGRGSTSNQLFRNNRDGTFTDLAGSLDVDDPFGRGRDVHWIDVNNDGNLDLYVSNARRTGFSPRLFRGDGTSFRDVTIDAGLEDEVDILGGSSWCDYDGDGNIDLLIAGYAGLVLRRNLGGGKFAPDGARSAGLETTRVRSTSWGDSTNDGLQDLFVARIGENARLYRNKGGGVFEDVTSASGIDARRAAAGVWGDFDNDGYLDLFVVREYSPEENLNLPNLLYMNNGDGTFTEAGAEAGLSGPGAGAGDSAAIADFNNDGFLDVIVTHGGLQVDEPDGPVYAPFSGRAFPPGRIEQYPHTMKPVSLYRNDGNRNHWLELRLEGATNNRFAYGAKVWLTAGGLQQFREISDGVVQYGQSDRIVHFGLGKNHRVDEVTIRWPSGYIQRLTDLDSDQILGVRQAAI